MCECISLNIPEHLWHNGRAIIHDFSNENIFRRFKATGTKEEWQSSKMLSASIFHLKSDSYNRSQFSIAQDVLYNTRCEDNGAHYINWGILSIPYDEFSEIGDLIIYANNQERKFTLNMIHSPTECMYPHSELLVYENGNEVNIHAPKSIGVIIRDFLVKKCTIIQDPKNEINPI